MKILVHLEQILPGIHKCHTSGTLEISSQSYLSVRDVGTDKSNQTCYKHFRFFYIVKTFGLQKSHCFNLFVVFKIVHLNTASSVMCFTCKKPTNENNFIKLPLIIFQRTCMFYKYNQLSIQASARLFAWVLYSNQEEKKFKGSSFCYILK